jgi:hypothetical protein
MRMTATRNGGKEKKSRKLSSLCFAYTHISEDPLHSRAKILASVITVVSKVKLSLSHAMKTCGGVEV